MSGVGSTNAMKKGSANNPFLAYNEADMQSFLNSAYTGCIVKYTGPSTKKLLAANASGDAQNLIADTSKTLIKGAGGGNVTCDITIQDSQTYYKIYDLYINRRGYVYDPEHVTNPEALPDCIYAILLIKNYYRKYQYEGNFNIKDMDVTFLAVEESVSENPSLLNLTEKWPLTKGINGWQTNCFNTEGRITLWGHDDTVKYTYNLYSSSFMYDEPYVVNALYKVVYGNGQYYFEEFYHISENITTATVEDVAPGKTFYDFTGTKQTGTGTKINPYLATDLDTFKSFPVGSFIKWLGPDKTVLDETTGQRLIQGEIYRAVEDGDVFQYVILPTLSNPGTAADLAQGKQLIDGEGKVVEGTAGGEIDYTKDVMFWDYDGTLIYACTLEEAKAMTKLPDAPSHASDGLVFSKWNWTLEQLHELTAPVDVGAMYVPADGNSHIFISVDCDNCEFNLCFSGTYSNNDNTIVSINWGDGNTETYSYLSSNGTSFNKTHVYSSKGEYEIIIQNITSNTAVRYNYLLGYVNVNNISIGLCGASVDNSGYLNKNYLSSKFTNSLLVKKVYIGNRCGGINIAGCINCGTKVGKYIKLLRGELVNNTAIKHINASDISSYSMRESVVETCSFGRGVYLGYGCFSSNNLKRLAIYNGEGTGDYETLGIPSLRFISIANSYYSKYTGFPGLVFVKKATVGAKRADSTQRSSIEELTLSEMCKEIHSYDFISYSAVKKLIVKNSAPPTLTNKFTNIQPDLKIYVPDESIDTYKTKTGWKDMADRIYPMSALTN